MYEICALVHSVFLESLLWPLHISLRVHISRRLALGQALSDGDLPDGCGLCYLAVLNKNTIHS